MPGPGRPYRLKKAQSISYQRLSVEGGRSILAYKELAKRTAQGELTKMLRGHHGKIVLCWICSLVFVLPIILAAGIVSVRYLPKILFDVMMDEEVPADYLTSTLIILGIGAALSLPMLPLRSMVTAAYVNGLKKS